MKTTMPLARFISRHAMVYERTYPHAIELVWEAVSTSSHLDVWLLPVTSVERRVGGRCSFTWGGPDKPEQVGEVTTFDQLDAYLAGAWTAADVEPALARYRAHGPEPDDLALMDAYRVHIREACPPA